MKGPYFCHCSFLHQEQKYQDIHFKFLADMTTLVNLISLSGQSCIVANPESLVCGKIYSPFDNTTSLYLNNVFFVFNYSLDTPKTVFDSFIKILLSPFMPIIEILFVCSILDSCFATTHDLLMICHIF